MIIRIEHLKNFTTISNKTLRDSNLSWKARGLLAFFLTHSDGYQIRIDNMAIFSKQDGLTSVMSGIRELKSAGYMTFRRGRNLITKAWQAGEWFISEEPANKKSLIAGNLESGKPLIRKSVNQENPMLYKKDQEERRTKKKEILIKRKDFFSKKDSFDLEDLPTHLGKHPLVAKAWSEFVEHRKQKKCPLTPLAWKKTIQSMMSRSPDEIIAAIDKAISSGWRGLFFNENNQSQGSSRKEVSRDRDYESSNVPEDIDYGTIGGFNKPRES